MMDAQGFVEQIRKQQEWKETEVRFYAEFIPTIVGKVFAMPRSYGHARYEILPTHERGLNTTYTLFHYNEQGEPVLTGNQIYPRTLRVNFKRIGGYEGLGSEFLAIQDLLKKFTKPDHVKEDKSGARN